MAEVVIYRTYPIKPDGRDPILDTCEDAIKERGLTKRPGIIKELTNVSATTVYNILGRKTRNARHSTAMALLRGLGKKLTIEDDDFDLDEARADAKRWNLRQKARGLATSRGRRKNGKENRVSA
jgi:hypothetical protein